MKIRGRLIVSFLIMTIFPLCAGFFCFHTIMKNQTNILNSYYNVDKEEYDDYGLVLNPLQILYSLTSEDYESIVDIADHNPDKFMDKNYLDNLSDELEGHDSFCIVLRDDRELYVGDEKYSDTLSELPGFGNYNAGTDNTISLDKNTSSVIRKKDFYFSDGTKGQIFLITNMSNLLPRWSSSVRDIVVSFLIVLLFTAVVLIVWIYHSVVKPLNLLRIATKQIGAGNLSDPVHVNSSDEIGELCRDFEEMRIRLKSMLDERIHYEQNTREIMSNISHDLKTPLTAIKGYSEGLIDGVADTPEKQEKYLRTIMAKAIDMTYLVDELSLFSKIEQNSLPYNFVNVNLNGYFEDCIDELSFDLESKGISVTYQNYTSPDTIVMADVEQLHRVVNNIIGNSVKYIDKKEGHILISITDVVRKSRAPLYRQINKDGTDVEPPKKKDEFVRIEISDNGPGIAPDEVKYIFDRFYRADASRNSSKRGSGLGLAIAKKIIDDHEGMIWAASTPGSGTSIFFTLKKID